MDSTKLKLINISGAAGAGKTSLSLELQRRIREASFINSDNFYNADGNFPKSTKEWMKNGSNMQEWDCSLLIEAILSLKAGVAAYDPITGKKIYPMPILILDNGFGRILESIDKFIDFGVYIDIPFEYALARYVKRGLVFHEVNKTSHEEYISGLTNFIVHYLENDYSEFHNLIYRNVKANNDLVIHWGNAVEDSVTKIIETLHSRGFLPVPV